jgi:hypothetical protein
MYPLATPAKSSIAAVLIPFILQQKRTLRRKRSDVFIVNPPIPCFCHTFNRPPVFLYMKTPQNMVQRAGRIVPTIRFDPRGSARV